MSGLEIEITVENVERVSSTLASIQARVMPTVIKTARRAVWRTAIPDTKKSIASGGGIGQRIWGVNPIGLDKVVKAGRLVLAGEESRTSLVLVGIPALLERGGRINAHYIKRGFGRKGNRIPHPGMMLHAKNYAQRALDRAKPTIQRDANEAVAEMLRRHGF